MSDEYQSMVANAVAHAAAMSAESIRCVAGQYERPSVLYKPTLSLDGNQWCALLGDNLQVGLAAFGDTPAKAMWNFDKAFEGETK
jgi:hypothetical protein